MYSWYQVGKSTYFLGVLIGLEEDISVSKKVNYLEMVGKIAVSSLHLPSDLNDTEKTDSY